MPGPSPSAALFTYLVPHNPANRTAACASYAKSAAGRGLARGPGPQAGVMTTFRAEFEAAFLNTSYASSI